MKNAEYVGAVCSFREKSIISQEKFEKMLSMSLPEAVKTLKDSGFGGGIETTDAESLIRAEEDNLISFIKEYAPNDNFINFKLLNYDYHNANSIVRAVNLNINQEKMLIREGRFSYNELSSFIASGEGDIESKFLKEAIIEAKKLFESGKATGAKLDDIFLKAKYQEALSLVKKEKSLKAFVQAEIDGANVSTAIRSQNAEFLKEAFILGGNISLSDLVYFIETGKLTNSLKASVFGSVLLKTLADFKKGKALVEFEKVKDDYALSTLIKDKYTVAGYDIFYLYCYYKENEIKNARIVTVGLSAGLDKADVKARMRVNYAG